MSALAVDVDLIRDAELGADDVEGVHVEAGLGPGTGELAGVGVAPTVGVGLDLADDETGRVAVKLLLEAIQEGEDFQQRRSFLPTRVVARQSTGGTP